MLTVKEAAELLNTKTTQTVRNYIHNEGLPAIKVPQGRKFMFLIKHADLEKFKFEKLNHPIRTTINLDSIHKVGDIVRVDGVQCKITKIHSLNELRHDVNIIKA